MILRLFLLFLFLFGFVQNASAFNSFFDINQYGGNFYIECSDINNWVGYGNYLSNDVIQPLQACNNFELPTIENMGGFYYFSNGENDGNYVLWEIENGQENTCETNEYSCLFDLSIGLIGVEHSSNDFSIFVPFVPLNFAVITPLDASTMLANVANGVKDTGANLWVIVALAISIPLTWHVFHLIIETMPDEKTK